MEQARSKSVEDSGRTHREGRLARGSQTPLPRAPRHSQLPALRCTDARRVGRASPPAGRTLGDVGIAYRISAKSRFPTSYLRIAFDPNEAPWIDPTTIRVFHATAERSALRPLWRSGVNIGQGFIWAKVEAPGIYVPIGLPRDRLLLETLRRIATNRCREDCDPGEARRLTVEPLERLLDLGGDDLDELRDRIAAVELASASGTNEEKEAGLCGNLSTPGFHEGTFRCSSRTCHSILLDGSVSGVIRLSSRESQHLACRAAKRYDIWYNVWNSNGLPPRSGL